MHRDLRITGRSIWIERLQLFAADNFQRVGASLPPQSLLINPTCHQNCGSLDASRGLPLPPILSRTISAPGLAYNGRRSVLPDRSSHKETRNFEAAARNLSRIAPKEVSK